MPLAGRDPSRGRDCGRSPLWFVALRGLRAFCLGVAVVSAACTTPPPEPDASSSACGGQTDWASPDSRIRDARPTTKALLQALDMHPGHTVWDIGAGAGYFTRKMTFAVGADGTVVATESDPICLNYLATVGMQWGPARLLTQAVRFWVPLPLEPLAHRVLMANSLVFSDWGRQGGRLHSAIAEGLAARVLFEGTRPGGRVVYYLDFEPSNCIPASDLLSLFGNAGFDLLSEQDPWTLDDPAKKPDAPEHRCRSFALFLRPTR